MEKSPLLKNSKFLKREFSESGGNSEAHSTDYVLFRDYLKQQIDLLMTGDGGRDGVAEGRRGTHVEVQYLKISPSFSRSGSDITLELDAEERMFRSYSITTTFFSSGSNIILQCM